MIGDVVSLAERQHRQFVEREAKRAAHSLRSLAGLTLIELAEDQRADGTRSWGSWSALTHLPAKRELGVNPIPVLKDAVCGPGARRSA